jgi:hypothetical protein
MNQITINLTFYGSLKSFFGEKQQMQVPEELDLAGVVQILKKKQPMASAQLDSCRLAVGSEFEAMEYRIIEPVEVVVMPPFSGG